MTKDKDEKAVIRARMARTGESYAAARAQLAREAPPVDAKQPAGYMKFSAPAEKACVEARGPEATAWHVILALRSTEGIASRVLSGLRIPLVDLDREFARDPLDPAAAPMGSPLALGLTYSSAWQKAVGAAAALAVQEDRLLIDSGILLRAAVSLLGVVPAHWADVADQLREADLRALCAAAEKKYGSEQTPKQADGSERTGMFERFTDKARQVVVMAQEEARRLDHNWIGTEHVLLGLVKVEDGVAAKALTSLGVSLDQTRVAVEAIIGRGDEPPSGHIPFTPRAKSVLEHSLRAALEMNHNYIGTEHLLLGLLSEPQGVACTVLVQNDGVTLEAVRAKVLELLEEYRSDDPA